MTTYEFEHEYQKLADAYPEIYGKKFRKELIAKSVHDLDRAWFGNIVKRLILNPYLKFDIDEAARSERINRSQVKRTKEEINALNNIAKQSSENGLKDVLKMFNANSLEEAIKNSTKINSEVE